MQKYPNSQIAVATFALAGIDSPKDHTAVVAIVQNALQTTQLQVDTLIIENDAEATLLGVTAGQAGALLIAEQELLPMPMMDNKLYVQGAGDIGLAMREVDIG